MFATSIALWRVKEPSKTLPGGHVGAPPPVEDVLPVLEEPGPVPPVPPVPDTSPRQGPYPAPSSSPVCCPSQPNGPGQDIECPGTQVSTELQFERAMHPRRSTAHVCMTSESALGRSPGWVSESALGRSPGWVLESALGRSPGWVTPGDVPWG